MLTKLDCQWAFTPILLVCRPLDQAYRHGNEVGREWERKRDGVGCVGMAWPPSNKHTLAHMHTMSNTQTWPGTHPGFVQMGYYSDVQLYTKNWSTRTAMSGQLKATTSISLENNQDGVTADATKWKVFFWILVVNEGFSWFVIHGSRKLCPTWKGTTDLIHSEICI